MGDNELFPAGTKSLPVPSPLLGSLLAEIDDMAELKCTLRFLWHAAQVKGSPKWVRADALEADSVLLEALGSREAVRAGLAAAAARGTLVESGGRYLLGTPENVRTASSSDSSASKPTSTPAEVRRGERENVFALYESNVGLMTPLVADQLRDAETEYPAEWIEAAIQEAAERNVRNWRYIASILERWAVEGRGPQKGTKQRHGEPGRHTETASAAEYLRQRRTAG